MHLSQVKKHFKSAFARYVEFLVEDCTADFDVKDGRLYVTTEDGKRMVWAPNPKKADMSVGSGWEEVDVPMPIVKCGLRNEPIEEDLG